MMAHSCGLPASPSSWTLCARHALAGFTPEQRETLDLSSRYAAYNGAEPVRADPEATRLQVQTGNVIRLPENSEPEHEKLAMGPWRTPERVLTGRLSRRTSLEALGRPPRQRPDDRYLPARPVVTTAPAQDGPRPGVCDSLTPGPPFSFSVY